jgi:hypothetical protein
MTINARHFDPRPENVRAARRFVQGAVGADYDLAQLAMLTSELVTDAVRDGESFYLFVQEVSRKVHVEVQYREPACPGRETMARIANRLRVLRALANRSGIHVAAGEITEWFEIGRSSLAPVDSLP